MASTTLTADIIAKEALMILDNELVFAKNVFRGYDDEFSKNINGYKIGDTISIRKPTDYTVRTGITAAVQDTIEGKVQLTVNQVAGIDFRFSSTDMTLKVDEFSDRFIKPAMIQIANQIDSSLAGLYNKVPQWVGTPGQVINSFADFALGPQQLDTFAVPQDSRFAALSPADQWGLLPTASGLFINDANKSAYRDGYLGKLGGVETAMSQNVQSFTAGTRTGVTGAINASITTATTTYDTVKNTNAGLTVQTISVTNLGGATVTVKTGDVFTIAGVYAVNPVTKARTSVLKQFVVTADFTAATSGITNLTISPAMIWTGAFKNIDTASTDLNTLTLSWVGTAGSVTPQNMVFHKNAFALVTVPMEMPQGAVGGSRRSYKGTNVRIQPYYDGVNDLSSWRFDVLYGLQAIDPRLATRISGT